MTAQPAVVFEGVTRRFPGVVALDNVSLQIAAGSVHALVGENGAGKSTLGKVLAGIEQPDGGRVILFGQPMHAGSPADALKAGVGMVHQELAFAENMTVAENLLLGQMPHRGLFVNYQAMHERAAQMLSVIGADIPLDRPMATLTVGQQQMVQIAASVARGARVLVFDEPTSSLSAGETASLYQLVRRLHDEGVTCIYVSHRLQEVLDLCDTVSVMRDGRLVSTLPVEGITEQQMVRLMIGRDTQPTVAEDNTHSDGAPMLSVRLSSPGKFRDIALEVRPGEIVGLAGLVGAGRTELLEAVFGLDELAQGEVLVHGKPIRLGQGPGWAMAAGVGLIPEDRKRHGLAPAMTVRENITLPILGHLSRLGWVDRSRERSLVQDAMQRLAVRAPSTETPAASLSGGNQQKLIISRWIAAQCQVLLVDEPTRGVDVGAKAEIHALLRDITARGGALLLASSDLPELLAISTRLLVIRQGRIVGALSRDQFNAETVGMLMTGSHRSA